MTKEIIIIQESLLKSIMKDCFTFSMIILLIGLGVFLKSTAMQWMGFICVFAVIISRFGKSENYKYFYSYQSAINHLEKKKKQENQNKKEK